MIPIYQKERPQSLDISTSQITLLFDSKSEFDQDTIIQLLKSQKNKKYYGIIGRKNNMIPFLSILDNLLLNIPKKNKDSFLKDLSFFLEQFKLEALSLNQPASTLSTNQQLVLQISRGIILNQTIIIFDQETNFRESDNFLINIMPILNRVAHQRQSTVIIYSTNIDVAKNPYYDHCFLLDNLSS